MRTTDHKTNKMKVEQIKDSIDKKIIRLTKERTELIDKITKDFSYSYEWGIADELYLVEAQLRYLNGINTDIDVIENCINHEAEMLQRSILFNPSTNSQSTLPAKNRANQLKDEAYRLVYSFIVILLES